LIFSRGERRFFTNYQFNPIGANEKEFPQPLPIPFDIVIEATNFYFDVVDNFSLERTPVGLEFSC
jgi:hypothetical protein